MEANNIENGMKVYFDGDSEWYASPLNIEETKKMGGRRVWIW
ncbi:hypothetical protein PMY12_15575 [Clostridium tertium]|nr:hypothetical protein [Clostridium tertium]MDB1935118.1 hypothetical protein [Clostridium tertium]MDB1938427.1 hypothetical protein [Clostridium tertium]